jgi:hypothetical protein
MARSKIDETFDPIDVLQYAIDEFGHSQAELAELLGRSSSSVGKSDQTFQLIDERDTGNVSDNVAVAVLHLRRLSGAKIMSQ